MDKIVEPLISVVMPVYNAEPFLREAIESILNQTFQNFEFLIFDDGSTDKSAAIISSFNDERIKSVYSIKNQGYVYHLNEGLRRARGKYIVRMDADDISDKLRIEKQVRFMESNPHVGVSGGQIAVIDNHDKILREQKYQVEDDKLRVQLLMDSCFAHPTVILRKSLITETNLNYDSALMPAEDYALWGELAAHTDLANLPDILLKYRNHQGQITVLKQDVQKQSADKVRIRQVEFFLNRKLSKDESILHNSLLSGEYSITKEYVTKARLWIESILQEGSSQNTYDTQFLNEEFGKIWFKLCTHSYEIGPWIISIFFSANINRRGIPSADFIKFIVKSVFKFSPFDKNKSNSSFD